MAANDLTQNTGLLSMLQGVLGTDTSVDESSTTKSTGDTTALDAVLAKQLAGISVPDIQAIYQEGAKGVPTLVNTFADAMGNRSRGNTALGNSVSDLNSSILAKIAELNTSLTNNAGSTAANLANLNKTTTTTGSKETSTQIDNQALLKLLVGSAGLEGLTGLLGGSGDGTSGTGTLGSLASLVGLGKTAGTVAGGSAAAGGAGVVSGGTGTIAAGGSGATGLTLGGTATGGAGLATTAGGTAGAGGATAAGSTAVGGATTGAVVAGEAGVATGAAGASGTTLAGAGTTAAGLLWPLAAWGIMDKGADWLLGGGPSSPQPSWYTPEGYTKLAAFAAQNGIAAPTMGGEGAQSYQEAGGYLTSELAARGITYNG